MRMLTGQLREPLRCRTCLVILATTLEALLMLWPLLLSLCACHDNARYGELNVLLGLLN
jgi:hypothetical protein